MAGRPAGSTKASSEAKKESSIDSATEDYKKENELLKSQLDEMLKLINSLKDSQSVQASTSEIKLDMDSRISVTSITTGGVNLKTSTDGTAKIFRFEKLGQTLPILYVDLINCINLNRSFFEEGLLYINNPKVIEDNYLEEFYKRFLTLDKITNIMSFDSETIKNMVVNTTTAIQETICLLVAEKINKGESIDMNKVEVIGKNCNPIVDIRELANKIR
jgi:hypothetical protein